MSFAVLSKSVIWSTAPVQGSPKSASFSAARLAASYCFILPLHHFKVVLIGVLAIVDCFLHRIFRPTELSTNKHNKKTQSVFRLRFLLKVFGAAFFKKPQNQTARPSPEYPLCRRQLPQNPQRSKRSVCSGAAKICLD